MNFGRARGNRGHGIPKSFYNHASGRRWTLMAILVNNVRGRLLPKSEVFQRIL